MDRKTELRLSLYLDGLLPENERQEFEARLERNPELRDAVAFHRQAARTLAEAPDLPPGFMERSLTRLEEASAPPTAFPWWRRFWSLETAGLVAAAALVALILYPVLVSRDKVPDSEMPAEFDAPVTSDTKPGFPQKEKAVGLDGGFQQEVPSAAGPAEPVAPESPSLQAKAQPPQASAEDRVIAREVESDSAAAREAAATVSPKVTSRDGEKVALRQEAGLELTVGGGPEEIPFRILPFPYPADLGDRRFLLVRTERDLAGLSQAARPDEGATARKAEPPDRPRALSASAESAVGPGQEPVDFSREMAILLPGLEMSPHPVRVEVHRVWKSGTILFVGLREAPLPEPNTTAGPSPSFQLLVLPSADLEIRLVKVD